jgi:hypothetical protein
MNIENIAPYLSGVGFTLISIDADEVGADDIAGQFLLYGGEAINAVSTGLNLPPLPETITGLVAGKLSSAARTALTIAGTVLTILQIQVAVSKPKLATALRYIGQGIAALLASRQIPSAPVGLTA